MFTATKKCRSCGARKLTKILSLGDQYIIGFYFKNGTPSDYAGLPQKVFQEVKVPLKLILCNSCKLLQLRNTTEPSLLWNENYGYRSGINNTMRNELEDIVRSVESQVWLHPNDIVVDIGSNDGTLLSFYKKDVMRVGYEPSSNVNMYVMETLKNKKYQIFSDFFHKEPYLRQFKAPAKVVTAIAMFYDLDNPNRFVVDVAEILADDGVFVIQQNYLVGMLKNVAFDNIVHEHLEYYSLFSLKPLLERNGLEVTHVTQNEINGGSFRTYIHKKGKFPVSESVRLMLDEEKELGLDKVETYRDFAKKVHGLTDELSHFIREEHKKGKKIYVYGASTRGNTLLQAANLNNEVIEGAAERNVDKWGKITAGTHIPIVSEKAARKEADYFLVLPWFFQSEILKRENEFLKRGGILIFPLPEFKLVRR